MRLLARQQFQRLVADTRGAEIAEAAAVLPLMFMVLLGIFWFGQAFSIYGAITRAAQEAARAGSYSANCATCGTDLLSQRLTSATSAAQASLLASKLDPARARQPVPAPTLHTVRWRHAVLQPSCRNQFLCAGSGTHDTPSGATGACGISVSFQYPFQFWLPFTSLNKQRIWISSSALVRLENQ